MSGLWPSLRNYKGLDRIWSRWTKSGSWNYYHGNVDCPATFCRVWKVKEMVPTWGQDVGDRDTRYGYCNSGFCCIENFSKFIECVQDLMKIVVFLLLVVAIIGIKLLFDKIEQSGKARRNWMHCTFAWKVVPCSIHIIPPFSD